MGYPSKTTQLSTHHTTACFPCRCYYCTTLPLYWINVSAFNQIALYFYAYIISHDCNELLLFLSQMMQCNSFVYWLNNSGQITKCLHNRILMSHLRCKFTFQIKAFLHIPVRCKLCATHLRELKQIIAIKKGNRGCKNLP